MIDISKLVIEQTGTLSIIRKETIQTLWSGYGEIQKYFLKGGEYPSIIVKNIYTPDTLDHPRGWNTAISHQRKLKSYQVEKNWYQKFASQTNSHCKVPACVYISSDDTSLIIMMEDLDRSGFSKRHGPDTANLTIAKTCLSWLANFHAVFMGQKTDELWPIGTYWHLDTRPDEWAKMKNDQLKDAARMIDSRLNEAQFQTIVHGDAKLANFCFGENEKIAAVDFQYVGRGCGMKDVAYLISSCFNDYECEKHEDELLEHYFKHLEGALVDSLEFDLIKTEWIKLYPYAWADFYRFLDGWSPGHWKMHSYSKRLTQRAINDRT